MKPEKEPPRLLSNPDKIALLEEMGIDILCNIPFTRELADLSADGFLTLLEDKGVRAVGIGTNFSFGAGGTGNVDFLNKVHEKYETHPLDQSSFDLGWLRDFQYADQTGHWGRTDP